MKDWVEILCGLCAAVFFFAFIFLLNLALFALIGIAGAWAWNTFLVPATDLPFIAWWECALGLLVIRWVLAFLLPRRS